ncbi:MAG TPA: polysaccharide biosynthesis protein [Terracidiphilus sp.]|nr:polysaccharide biosynthesis protein [Terracidiphilus sp.]
MVLSLGSIDWRGFLGRPPLIASSVETLRAVVLERILITGAGGSIGSRLARRLVDGGAQDLVLLDSSESHLMALQSELAGKGPGVHFVLGSVGDRPLLDEIFGNSRPTLLFHAAAYKHVPLLEQHPFAALENNVFGSETLIAAARDSGVRMVLLSTDKAVEPASMLGASKRIAELIALAAEGTVVRLGNVLASSGSVAEIFVAQIAAGGPITVTDPSARRYFLTVDEAADLLIAAAARAARGQLFVPALSTQHFIADLARFMAHQLAPMQTIGIEFTSPRPGDKESEKLWGSSEHGSGRSVDGLFTIESPRVENGLLRRALSGLRDAQEARDLQSVVQCLRMVVPDFTPSASLLRLAQRPLARATP